MPAQHDKDKTFDRVRFHAAWGFCALSALFLLMAAWLFHQQAEERLRLGQIIADNRQLVENQRLLQGALEQLRSNLNRQNERLKSKSEALVYSEQARTELEQERREILLQAQRRAETVERIREELAPAMQETGAQVLLKEDRITIRLPGRLLFDSGEADLREEGRRVFAAVAEVLRTRLAGLSLRVEAHTDNIPIGGNLSERFPTNWHLSSARACAAVDFLEISQGIAPDRLEAIGRGPHSPIGDNNTEEGRALNRRIDLVITLADE